MWSDAPVTAGLMRALGADAATVGVFACNDEMALSVYRAAASLGRRIPDEVSVIGFNDEPRAARVHPALSSVRQPLLEMAGRAVEFVSEMRLRPEAHHERVELPCELILRGSTLPVPAGLDDVSQ
jgi:LacI family transcriptional regulator